MCLDLWLEFSSPRRLVMRSLVWLVLMFFGVAPCFAQSRSPQMLPFPTHPMELSKLPPLGFDAGLDAIRCGGDYFLQQDNPNTKPRGMRIWALVKLGDDEHLISFLSEKWDTVIDESRKVPTVEYVLPGPVVAELTGEELMPRLFVGDGLTLTVRISKAEYQKASQCLPAPGAHDV